MVWNCILLKIYQKRKIEEILPILTAFPSARKKPSFFQEVAQKYVEMFARDATNVRTATAND